MIVVSNSSPLIFLSAAGFLELLDEEFKKIIIPTEVYNEVVVKGRNKKGSDEVKNAEWITVKDTKDKFIKPVLSFGLDSGETEVIALAEEIKADLILMDDLPGRMACEACNLNVLGTVGFLYREHKIGKIGDFDLALDKLRSAGFWISDELYNYYKKIK